MNKKVEMIGRGVRITRPVETVTLTLEEYLEGRYKKKREDLSSRLKMLLNRLEVYIQAMGTPTPKTIAQITDHQTTFLQTVLGFLSSDTADALMGWDILLFLANKNAVNLFNLKKACVHYHTMAEDRQQQFLAIMTLIVETANIRNRATFLSNSNLSNYTAILKDEKQRTNLAAYYAANI